MRDEDAVHVAAVRGARADAVVEAGKRREAIRLALGGEDALDRDEVFRVGRRVLAEVEDLLGRLGVEDLALRTESAVEAFCGVEDGSTAAR